MSHTLSIADQYSQFQSILNAASNAYTEKTGKDLTSQPLFAKLTTCDSADAIATVLRDQILGFDQPGSSDDRLTKSLRLIVKVLYSFSSTIGASIGSVSFRRRVIVQDLRSDIDFVDISSSGGDLYWHRCPPIRE